jgi:CHASE3 domain sensor protein
MITRLRAKRILWGLLFFLVSAAAGVAYVFAERYLAAANAVEQALAVQSTIDGTLSLFQDAETGQRGFVLTGDDEFLEPYDGARSKLR